LLKCSNLALQSESNGQDEARDDLLQQLSAVDGQEQPNPQSRPSGSIEFPKDSVGFC
jgi:hypothetical protein